MLRLRYPLAGALAAVVTILIFFQMHALIAMRVRPHKGLAGTKRIEFVRLKRDSDLQPRKRELPKKAAPEEPPPSPDLHFDLSRTLRPQSATLQGFAPTVDLSLDMTGGPNLGPAPSDTDIIPLVRVNPQYPFQARDRGIEGWVEVEFTISTAGTVKNPVVVDSHPGGVFDRASLRAIRRWKYRPKTEDGIAVERTGVRVRLRFDLED